MIFSKKVCFNIIIAFCISFSPFIGIAATSSSSSNSTPSVNIYEKNNSQVDVVADQLEYSKDQKKIIAKNNVVIRYQSTHITCDYAEVQTETKEAYAKGHVVIFDDNKPRAHGNELNYNFAARTGSFPEGRSINLPWVTSGKEINQVREGVKEVKDGVVTTCDREKTHYDITAKRITIYDQDKLIARNVKIRVLGKPIFWWPYIILPLNDAKNLPIAANVGSNSRWGTFILLSKAISVNKNIGGKVRLDWRSRRGVGGGLDLNYDYNKYAKGMIQTYLTQDKRAPSVNSENPFLTNEDRTRGRVTVRHRTDLDPNSNIILRYHKMADEYFLQDFFRKEFRSDLEPTSFATFTKNSENYGFFAHAQKQFSDFERITERLPEIRYNWKEQSFFSDKLFYGNEWSFANLGNQHGRSRFNEDVIRTHTSNAWSLPLQWEHIKFTPFTDLGGTFYTRDRQSSDAAFRGLWTNGIDIRTQSYKTFDVSFEKAGIEINQLRHVIEPNAQYLNRTSSVSDETIQRFDRVDRLDDANLVTLGVENRLQTKRVVNGKMQRVDIVSLNTFVSYEAHPDNGPLGPQVIELEDGKSNSAFTLWNQEVVLRPYQWLQAETRYDYDMRENNFRVFNQDLTLKLKRWEFLFGYRFANDVGSYVGSSQYVFDINWALNPLWRLGFYYRWSPEKQNTDEWQVSFQRDLHDFLLDFGYNFSDSNLSQGGNRELFFNFRMKGLPQYNLHQGRGRNGFATPRIGETVAGANSSALPGIYEDYNY